MLFDLIKIEPYDFSIEAISVIFSPGETDLFFPSDLRTKAASGILGKGLILHRYRPIFP